jgi:putative transcriptional regulator
MVRHDRDGAFGLIVNKVLRSTKYADLLKSMGADPEDVEGEIQIHFGGPVDPSRGFVLHSTDHAAAPMIPVNDRYGVTMSADLLKAIARGKGPKHALLAIGYAGWGKGQLEGEIERGGWAIGPANEEVLFDADYETKWKRALESRYIDA